MSESKQQYPKVVEKVKDKLKKLETRKQVAATIIKNNNNRTVSNKQKWYTKPKIKVDKFHTTNK